MTDRGKEDNTGGKYTGQRLGIDMPTFLATKQNIDLKHMNPNPV